MYGNSHLLRNIFTLTSQSFLSANEVPQSNRLRHHLMKQLKPLGPQIPCGFYSGPGDIAAWMGEARCDPGFDRTAEDSNDRNSGGCGFEIEGELISEDNDQIRIAAYDVASQVRIVRGMAFAGISLNQEVLSLDISQATEFIEKRLRKWVAVPLGPFGP